MITQNYFLIDALFINIVIQLLRLFTANALISTLTMDSKVRQYNRFVHEISTNCIYHNTLTAKVCLNETETCLTFSFNEDVCVDKQIFVYHIFRCRCFDLSSFVC